MNGLSWLRQLTRLLLTRSSQCVCVCVFLGFVCLFVWLGFFFFFLGGGGGGREGDY